jgi:hypothetical protein
MSFFSCGLFAGPGTNYCPLNHAANTKMLKVFPEIYILNATNTREMFYSETRPNNLEGVP